MFDGIEKAFAKESAKNWLTVIFLEIDRISIYSICLLFLN